MKFQIPAIAPLDADLILLSALLSTQDPAHRLLSRRECGFSLASQIRIIYRYADSGSQVEGDCHAR